MSVGEPLFVPDCDCDALGDALGVPDWDAEPVGDGVCDCVVVWEGVGEQPRLRAMISMPAYDGASPCPTSSENTSPTGAMGYAGLAGA